MSAVTPFHIAIPVHNLAECRAFYRDILNCAEGRSSDHWVDFNLFGHQLVIHYKPKSASKELKAKNVKFVIEPYIRFKGLVGEQATMFFLDPAGNALEFKAFKDMNQLFAK